MIGWAIRGHEANETLSDLYFLLLLLLPVGVGLQSCLTSPSQSELLSAPNPCLLLHQILRIFPPISLRIQPHSEDARLLRNTMQHKVQQGPDTLLFIPPLAPLLSLKCRAARH